MNADGELIMNAVRLIHSFLVYEIQQHLQKLKSIGSTPTEFPVRTKDGVRSSDIVWISQERKALTLHESAASLAPEICIEVILQAIPSARCWKRKICISTPGPWNAGSVMKMGSCAFTI